MKEKEQEQVLSDTVVLDINLDNDNKNTQDELEETTKITEPYIQLEEEQGNQSANVRIQAEELQKLGELQEAKELHEVRELQELKELQHLQETLNATRQTTLTTSQDVATESATQVLPSHIDVESLTQVLPSHIDTENSAQVLLSHIATESSTQVLPSQADTESSTPAIPSHSDPHNAIHNDRESKQDQKHQSLMDDDFELREPETHGDMDLLSNTDTQPYSQFNQSQNLHVESREATSQHTGLQPRKPQQAKSQQAESQQTEIQETESDSIQSQQIKSHQMKSLQIETNQVDGQQTNTRQTKTTETNTKATNSKPTSTKATQTNQTQNTNSFHPNNETSFESFKNKQYKREQEWVEQKSSWLKRWLKRLVRVTIKLPIIYGLQALGIVMGGMGLFITAIVGIIGVFGLGVAAFFSAGGASLIGECIMYGSISLIGGSGLVLLIIKAIYDKIMRCLDKNKTTNIG